MARVDCPDCNTEIEVPLEAEEIQCPACLEYFQVLIDYEDKDGDIVEKVTLI